MTGLGRLYFASSDWEKARKIYQSLVLQNIDPSAGVTKGEVYWALFARIAGRWSACDGASLATPARVRDTLHETGVAQPVGLGCGNAWAAHGAAMDGLAGRVAHRVAADAVDVAWLGRDAAERGALIDPADAAPVYVRNDVARTTAERAAARAAATR